MLIGIMYSIFRYNRIYCWFFFFCILCSAFQFIQATGISHCISYGEGISSKLHVYIVYVNVGVCECVHQVEKTFQQNLHCI